MLSTSRVSGQDEPTQQLVRFLADKELLLVLDNFEQLLDGVDLISELLHSAQGVQILITSRVVLHLQEEWLYPLGGLNFPFDEARGEGDAFIDVKSVSAFDAVRLFDACARRIRPDFDLDTEAAGVVRVCALVEGMPLAIELAAAWARTMSAGEIASELQRDLDFLSTSLRNVPEKHRSMQVVFQRSWQLLNPDERMAFKQLAVFRGGFDRTAANHVAGTSLPTLSALVDKSLLRWEPSGRYQVHELLRQFAEEMLAGSSQDHAHTRQRHCSYYANFLYDRIDKLTTQQRQALIETEVELGNLHLAWQWCLNHACIADIHRAAMPFFAYCQGQSRYREGAEILAAAFSALADAQPSAEHEQARADLLTGRGWLELRLGRLEAAKQVLTAARVSYMKRAILSRSR